jgi:hypothetical protein
MATLHRTKRMLCEALDRLMNRPKRRREEGKMATTVPACETTMPAIVTTSYGSPDVLKLKELIEAGNVTPLIARVYPLSATRAAIRYLETGYAQQRGHHGVRRGPPRSL